MWLAQNVSFIVSDLVRAVATSLPLACRSSLDLLSKSPMPSVLAWGVGQKRGEAADWFEIVFWG